MRRIGITVLLLWLVTPVVSFAGSATSRWDLTIGGFVKFDMGYNTQAQGQDIVLAQRSGNGPYDNMADRYGNFFSYAGETRLNFFTRGPDAWGAKTSAFIEGDFRGSQASTTPNQGTFALRQAWMKLTWSDSRLLIGQTWQKWGTPSMFSFNMLAFNNLGPFVKGQRQPQIRFEKDLSQNWTFTLLAISPTNTLGSNLNNNSSGTVDSYTMSGMPFFEWAVDWKSDKCGRVGAWPLTLGVNGFYGRQKQVVGFYTGPAAAPTSLTYGSKDVDSWGTAFEGFIPVVPQKNVANKKGAFSVSGVLFYMQNPGFYQGGTPGGVNSSYARLPAGDINFPGILPAAGGMPDFAAATQYGGWGGISYYFTHQLYFSSYYGYLRSNLSNAFQRTPSQANQVQNLTQIIANLMYDLNQAITLGVEYTMYNTRYAGYPTVIAGVPTTQKDGTAHSFRIGAFYFF